MVVPSAAQALRSGLLVGDGDDEFCFLAPRIGDPIRDHNLWGPTYAQALQWEGDRFHQIYVSPVFRIYRFVFLLMQALIVTLVNRFETLGEAALRQALLFCAFAYTTSLGLILRLQELFRLYIIQPIALLFVLVLEAFKGKEKYEPVAPVLDQDQAQPL